MASYAARLALLLALAGYSKGAWCLCRTDVPDVMLQRTLGYACGSTADCKPIQPSDACFAPDTVKAHCSYAVNSFFSATSERAWCVCRTDQPDATVHKTLDYACGGCADCKPILPNGACLAPDNFKEYCSYAINTFYERSGQNRLARVFSGTAALSPTDPSSNGCQYPANTSAALTGVDSQPGAMGQGPSGPLNDNSSGADILPVAGTAKRAVILVCCLLLALYFRFRIRGVLGATMILVLILTLAHADEALGVNTSSAVLPEQRPLLAVAEVLLPEAPQAQVFHLHPQNDSTVASGPAVATTLLLASIFFLMLMA